MKLLHYLSATSLLALVCACNRPTHYPAAYARKYPRGELREEDFFVDVSDDEEIFIFETTLMKSAGNYKDGKPEGLWTYWYDNGIREVGRYSETRREGVWQRWYYNGQERSRVTYVNGNICGTSTWWYMSGQKEEDEILNSQQVTWYRSGLKEMELNFRDGQSHGPFTHWHENGIKWMEGRTENGKLEGKYMEWDEEGVKIKELEYKNGEIVRVLIHKQGP